MPRQRVQRINRSASSPFGLSRFGKSGAHIIAFGLVALSLWMLVSFVGQVITSAQLERRKSDLQAEIAQLESERATLQSQVDFAESPAYAELLAREQLGYAREGDTVILPTFPEQSPVVAAAVPAPLSTPPPLPNWRGWIRALFPQANQP